MLSMGRATEEGRARIGPAEVDVARVGVAQGRGEVGGLDLWCYRRFTRWRRRVRVGASQRRTGRTRRRVLEGLLVHTRRTNRGT